MSQTRTIFFAGKPGCGKGTQAKLLSEATGWPVFSSGKLFRGIAAEDTPVGRKIKAENYAGILNPPWFAMYLYLKTIFSLADGANVILDGFNRKPPEAALNIESLRWLERPFQSINLVVSDEEIEKRLTLRKESSGREDDNFVSERLKEYYTYTEPAIELFRKEGVLIEINGEQTPEAIAADIRAALKI